MIDFIKWANNNSGFISILIFVISFLGAWLSGIFRSLRRKPKFKIDIIPGPTLCSTFYTGKKYQGEPTHITAISAYVNLTNIGSAPASIRNVWIGYHWSINKINWTWFRYNFFWFWLKSQIVALDDFCCSLNEDDIKHYPFLMQRSSISGDVRNTYLNVGESTNGVVYFEQEESWGGCFPKNKNGKVKLKLVVIDSFGNKYRKTFYAPAVSLDEAKKYNPSFGETILKLGQSQNNDLEKKYGENNNEIDFLGISRVLLGSCQFFLVQIHELAEEAKDIHKENIPDEEFNEFIDKKMVSILSSDEMKKFNDTVKSSLEQL